MNCWDNCECGYQLMAIMEDAEVPVSFRVLAAMECIKVTLPALPPADRRFVNQVIEATERWASGSLPIENLKPLIEDARARLDKQEREQCEAEMRNMPKRNPYRLDSVAEFEKKLVREARREHNNAKKRVRIKVLQAAIDAAATWEDGTSTREVVSSIIEVLTTVSPPVGFCSENGYARNEAEKHTDSVAAGARCATAIRSKVSPSMCPELTAYLI